MQVDVGFSSYILIEWSWNKVNGISYFRKNLALISYSYFKTARCFYMELFLWCVEWMVLQAVYLMTSSLPRFIVHINVFKQNLLLPKTNWKALKICTLTQWFLCMLNIFSTMKVLTKIKFTNFQLKICKKMFHHLIIALTNN